MSEQLRYIPGIGPKVEATLLEMGITSRFELLNFFPTRYRDYEETERIDGEKVTVIGSVFRDPRTVRLRGKQILKTQIQHNGDVLEVVVFNRNYLAGQLQVGSEVLVSGKYDEKQRKITAQEVRLVSDKGVDTLVAHYPLPPGMSKARFAKIMLAVFESIEIQNILPEYLHEKYRLISRREAYRLIHFPETYEDIEQARRYLKYEELFLFQLQMRMLHYMNANVAAVGDMKAFEKSRVDAFIAKLPFTLTDGQAQAVAEILNDLEQPQAMNRLLQGDVGSGKTVVGAIGLYANALAGYQGAFMAPTEILAEQHYEGLSELFAGMPVQVALLTSSTPKRERKQMLAELQAGLLDIIIGTHALIQDDIHFAKLGMVITDEQHRFGVEQRRILRLKGERVDVLSMSATPIPRTMAISVFGDMDVSSIRELPSGRKQIQTELYMEEQWDLVVEQMVGELRAGRQAYIVCPLIEESEHLDVQNATELYEHLRAELPEFRIGLLHGKQKSDMKQETIDAFKDHQLDVIVSTTVIEVGVNVPNATIMIVYDADRFGLAQLHQLRGRVGRGQYQSYCYLVTKTKKERLQILAETTDGFRISEYDLFTRGPGDFFGHKQSGLPDFKVANIVEDFKILEVARDDVQQMIASRDLFSSPDCARLREYLDRKSLLNKGQVD